MGTIQFYTGNDATGSNFYTIEDRSGQSINLKTISGKNDEARSLKLVNAVTGVVIKVYDSPDASTTDDWCEIEVLKQVPSCVVRTFERTYTDPDGVYRQTFHRNNGLDGKVSHVKTLASPPLQLDYVSLGRLFVANGWNDKGGQAAAFPSQDSQYRIYQPDVEPRLAANGTITGTNILVTIDHIRGGFADDHCYAKIEIGTGTDGEVSTTLDFKWGSDSVIPGAVKKIGVVAAQVAYSAAEVAGFKAAVAMVEFLAGVFKLVAQILKMDDGGRINFNAVVNHSINKILQSTRGTRS